MRFYPDADGSALSEYNHNHDPHSGKFASGGGVSQAAPDAGSGGGPTSSGSKSSYITRATTDQVKSLMRVWKDRVARNDDKDSVWTVDEMKSMITDAQGELDSRASARAASRAAKAAAPPTPAMVGGVELTPTVLASKNLSDLAGIVSRDWRKQKGGVNYAATPYLDALHSLDSISGSYGADSARSVVAYFLGNAHAWKGPVAKAVKAELNRRLKGK